VITHRAFRVLQKTAYMLRNMGEGKKAGAKYIPYIEYTKSHFQGLWNTTL